MRLLSLKAKDVPPVKFFEVKDLSDVVVLAGPNGVGKTRLIKALLAFFQSPNASDQFTLEVEPTCDAERKAWGKDKLDTSVREDSQTLKITLQKGRRRSDWKSSVLYFESDRTIQKIQPYAFSWDILDPWLEEIGWSHTFSGLQTRFQDTVHSIFRKLQSHKDAIARTALKLKEEGQTHMPLDFSNPLEPFKEVFKQLLEPKELLDPDPKTQKLEYLYEDKRFPMNTLSSGETEVVNIVFDFMLRNLSDSIVVFDEPELHLHPELSYKLLQSLRKLGSRNQFILCTHSPDIITAALDNSVVFIAPPSEPPVNQAIPVKEDDATHQALRCLGQSIGIVSLGKKIVLIEGENPSLDRKTYGTILRNRHPSLVLVPSGGKRVVQSFASILTGVLQNTIWGVEFFMLCDRDAVPFGSIQELELAGQGRLQVLGRYHLENYFLDEKILANAFGHMEEPESWLTSPTQIHQRLREEAKGLIPYTTALIVSADYRMRLGMLNIMTKDCHGRTNQELTALIKAAVLSENERISHVLKVDDIAARVDQVFQSLLNSVENDTDEWKKLVPGRPLFNIFANRAGIAPGRLKLMYLDEAERCEYSPFNEILSIFEKFAVLS